ncbi:MAG: toxin-antitoxin system YwqK family antitoxin [Patiriisocius sp.]|uniref:toxin-antitoxin system YwqK family antitoxin n=1 Tax=Patiriisocius sp. TaxID=2822396 RepID=UPI003EF1B9E4
MKKSFPIIILLLFIISCDKKADNRKYMYNGKLVTIQKVKLNDTSFSGYGGESYESGVLKSLTIFENGKIVDTLIRFYENGNIKKKGMVKNNMEYGWWIYNNENGKLIKKIEWFGINDSIYPNQEIYFDENENIKIKPNTSFELQIPDTLQIGKNIARINNYISDDNNIDTRYLFVLIENSYSDLGKRMDTFTYGSQNPFFGINAEKVGRKLIQGRIKEQTLKTDTIDGDSLSLVIKEHYKYFKKEFYVSDSGKRSALDSILRAEFKKMAKNN